MAGWSQQHAVAAAAATPPHTRRCHTSFTLRFHTRAPRVHSKAQRMISSATAATARLANISTGDTTTMVAAVAPSAVQIARLLPSFSPFCAPKSFHSCGVWMQIQAVHTLWSAGTIDVVSTVSPPMSVVLETGLHAPQVFEHDEAS
eukprot:364838-Chlamydomonas_euryale.AAC.14